MKLDGNNLLLLKQDISTLFGNTNREQYQKNNQIFEIISKLKKGNKIHIKKKNRGKFTEYCGGKVTNECISKGKNSSNPVIRKRATFAANARKWKHQKGGTLNKLNPYSVSKLITAIYQTQPVEEFLGNPAHNYDFTISEKEANKLGYFPDSRGHRDDRVKKETHPSHPSRGVWNRNIFDLTDKGMHSSNYTLFGLNDGNQDPQTVLTYKESIVLPEITVTPKEAFIFNPYDNIKLRFSPPSNQPKYKLKNKYQEGGQLTQEDSSRLWELNPYFGFNSSKEKYFNTWDFEKENTEVNDYFNSYLKSEGVDRILDNQNEWWKQRHPYKKFFSNSDWGTRRWLNAASKTNPYYYTYGNYGDFSAAYSSPSMDNSIITVGRIASRQFPYNFIEGHEFLHGKTPMGMFNQIPISPKSAQYEALQQNTNTTPGHNSRLEEKHADNWGLKYLFFKEGIYDARSQQDITLEQVRKLRERYPTLRPFKQMTDEEVQFQINHVASNQNKSQDNLG